MNNISPSREIVGLFSTRATFESAVKNLLAAGFERSDISVLSSHDSLEITEKQEPSLKDMFSALIGELKFEGPIIASGAVFLAGGPMAGTIAAVVGAAVSSVAIKEVIDEITSAPDSDDFARAVDAGSIILWVRATSSEQEDKATSILKDNGGANIHIHDSPTA